MIKELNETKVKFSYSLFRRILLVNIKLDLIHLAVDRFAFVHDFIHCTCLRIGGRCSKARHDLY